MKLKEILPSPNSRATKVDEAIKELAESIKAVGILEPLVVRPVNGRFQVVIGDRRRKALEVAGIEELPEAWVQVRPLTDAESEVLRTIENLHREDLHPIEELEGYERLLRLAEAGGTVETAGTIAAKIGKSLRYVQRALVFTVLDRKSREAFRNGKLIYEVAYQIARLPNEKDRAAAFKYAMGAEELMRGFAPRADDVARWIQRTIFLRLKGAPFPKTEPVGGVIACVDCPKRSGNQPVLFDLKAEELDDQTCLDPTCYRGKLAVFSEAAVAKLKAEGKPVLTMKEAKTREKAAITEKKLKTTAIILDRSAYSYGGPTYAQRLKGLFAKNCLAGCPDFAYVQTEDGLAQVCYNERNLKRLLREAESRPARGTEEGENGPARSKRPQIIAKKIRELLDEWLVEAVSPALAKSDTEQARLALLVTSAHWSRLNIPEEEDEALKEELKFTPEMAWGGYEKKWAEIVKLPPKQVQAVLQALLVRMAPYLGSKILDDVAPRLAVVPAKQLRLTAEMLAIHTKLELQKIAKELGLELEDAPKGEMVEALAKQMKAGKLPRAWRKVMEG